jgi:hypothetical protein
MNAEHTLYLVSPGPRPPYYEVADYLWGPEADIDSDGNSEVPEDPSWTELSLELRSGDRDQIIHIDPISESPLVLKVRSPSELLVKKAVEFLFSVSGGTVLANMPNI